MKKMIVRIKEVNLVEDNKASGGRGLDYVIFRDICYLKL
jgi:hypothetical protein